jgi:ribosomal subunit interface protein
MRSRGMLLKLADASELLPPGVVCESLETLRDRGLIFVRISTSHISTLFRNELRCPAARCQRRSQSPKLKTRLQHNVAAATLLLAANGIPQVLPMKLSISYKHVDAHEAIEKDVDRHVAKLNKLLKAYAPDLVQLHGVFAVNTHKEQHSCTLNLSLPTGSIHATGTGKNERTACKMAFSELEAQVKKHQALLRKDYQWKRKRPRERELVA